MPLMHKVPRVAVLLLALWCLGASASQGNEAASLEIHFVPEDMLTTVQLDPALFESYHIGMVSFADRSVASDLWQRARADIVGHDSVGADVRWGVKIFGQNGGLLGEYYVDKWGTSGYANGAHAQFGGELHRWLKAHVLLFND